MPNFRWFSGDIYPGKSPLLVGQKNGSKFDIDSNWKMLVLLGKMLKLFFRIFDFCEILGFSLKIFQPQFRFCKKILFLTVLREHIPISRRTVVRKVLQKFPYFHQNKLLELFGAIDAVIQHNSRPYRTRFKIFCLENFLYFFLFLILLIL